MELSEKKLQELKENKISIENLYEKYFYTEKDGVNVENVLKLLNESICSFKQIVDKFEDIRDYRYNPCLKYLLSNKKLFDELIQNNILNKEDLRYLLNRIDKWNELDSLCDNTSLLKYILNEFVLNKKIVDKLNTIVEKDDFSWYKAYNIHTIFDLIEYENKDNEEILKLNELNRFLYVSDLAEDEKAKLIEVLKDDEIARNRLIQIVENHLESNFDFESLMNYLKKKEKKNVLNI